MTNEEIKMCLARMADGKSSDVMNFDYSGTLKYICTLEKENRRLKGEIESAKDELQHEHNTQIDWFEQCCKLNSENAELRARLDKAVELKEPDIELNPYTGDWELRYQEVITKIKAYDSREEAESRLAELKGER